MRSIGVNRYSCLARSAKLLTGPHILLALISFFIYFNDFLETNYLRIRWADFRNLFTYESVLGADDRWTSFSDISRDVAMATNFVKK